jgi:hypothetical protein
LCEDFPFQPTTSGCFLFKEVAVFSLSFRLSLFNRLMAPHFISAGHSNRREHRGANDDDDLMMMMMIHLVARRGNPERLRKLARLVGLVID